MKRLLVIGATASLLSACAAFQTNPTETACEQAGAQLANAQAAYTAAQLALTIAQQVVTNPDAIAKAQKALDAAGLSLSAVQNLFDQKCENTPPTTITPPSLPPKPS